MSLTEHLAELRMRIIRAGLAVFLGALLVFAFYDTVLGWLLEPYEQPVRRPGRAERPGLLRIELRRRRPAR